MKSYINLQPVRYEIYRTQINECDWLLFVYHGTNGHIDHMANKMAGKNGWVIVRGGWKAVISDMCEVAISAHRQP